MYARVNAIVWCIELSNADLPHNIRPVHFLPVRHTFVSKLLDPHLRALVTFLGCAQLLADAGVVEEAIDMLFVLRDFVHKVVN